MSRSKLSLYVGRQAVGAQKWTIEDGSRIGWVKGAKLHFNVVPPAPTSSDRRPAQVPCLLMVPSHPDEYRKLSALHLDRQLSCSSSNLKVDVTDCPLPNYGSCWQGSCRRCSAKRKVSRRGLCEAFAASTSTLRSTHDTLIRCEREPSNA